MRALVDGRLGRFDRASALIKGFLEETKDEFIYPSVFATIGSELEDHSATRELALAVYEASIYNENTSSYSRFDFDNGCVSRLVAIYMRDERPEDARRILLDFINDADASSVYDQEYAQQMRLQGLHTVAGKLAELGFVADAINCYGEALALDREIGVTTYNYIGNREQIVRQCREGISRSLDGLKGDELKATLDRLLVARKAGPAQAKAKPGGKAAKKPEAAVDLMVLVHPHLLDKARVRSLLAESIGVPGQAAVPAERTEQLAAAARSLETLRKEHPDDLSVAIAEALVALGLPDPGRIDPALDRLEALVNKAPLEPLPEGARPNSRQRAAAGRQVPLWLVARARCAAAAGLGPDARRREDALDPGDRGGPPPGRQRRDDGDAPRAGRAGAGPRRPPRRRGRLVQDARDCRRAAEEEAPRARAGRGHARRGPTRDPPDASVFKSCFVGFRPEGARQISPGQRPGDRQRSLSTKP